MSNPYHLIIAYCCEQDPTVTVREVYQNIRLENTADRGEYGFSVWNDKFRVPKPADADRVSKLIIADKSKEKLQSIADEVGCYQHSVNPAYAALVKLLTTHFPETYPTVRSAYNFIKAAKDEAHPPLE